MLVQLESADPRTDAEDVFDLEMQEVQTETRSGNYEHVMVTDVGSLNTIFEASEQQKIIVRDAHLTSDFNGADIVVTEYNYYVE